MGSDGGTVWASKSSGWPVRIRLTTNDGQPIPSDARWYVTSVPGKKYESDQTVILGQGSQSVSFSCNSSTPYLPPVTGTITVGPSGSEDYQAQFRACGWITVSSYYFNESGGTPQSGQWHTSGESGWHGNGQFKYLPGTYTILFQNIANHAPPQSIVCTVSKGSNSSYTGCWYRRIQIYVDDVSGSDTNHGGSLNPYRTIQNALNEMPNDQFTTLTRYIYVTRNDGSYYENITFPTDKTMHLYEWNSNRGVNVYGYHSPYPLPSNINCHGINIVYQ
jgi:hypothetical protein